VESLWMFEQKQCFGFAVASLLIQIVFRTLSAVVPKDSALCECNPLTRLLQTPTDVDIVTRLSKLRVKTIDLLERFAAKRHLPTGDVLGQLIASQHVRRLSRASRYTC